MAFSDKPKSYNQFATGNKIYGLGRTNPTIGPVDRTGYKERDARTKARRNALLRMMQAKQSGRFMSSAGLRKP